MRGPRRYRRRLSWKPQFQQSRAAYAKRNKLTLMRTQSIRAGRLVTGLALLAAAWTFSFGAADRSTPLDRYVAAPDDNYKYQVVSTIPGKGYTAYVVDLTSQKW